ncbi:CRISPR-associated protein Cmr5 [Hydrogenivirga caldilitoris]|uniref:CRISPR type III-B/RAMP module-associated protein Cmr5 n=1 Tax=Hydrogenivirga caldilitoris TaxID=246264 RepID=A0A497XQY3_9AQUI|nr:type III-B CRISPR module-associated protein Cmr5 [Hydrogenivirga caldilitoris]RLJ70691.1 CRISPR-associated protein Cmr5 [Hydrogenivirga caldilitoris]
MRSKVQEIAGFAYRCISEVKGKEMESQYSSYVRKLPSMITHNGILTTVTFVNAKARENKAWAIIKKHVEDYLKEMEKESTNVELVKFFAELELSQYRLYTKKLLFFTQWLKRIAEGELKYEEKQE